MFHNSLIFDWNQSIDRTPMSVQTGISGESDCVQDPNDPERATGETQAGQTQTCTFINTRG
jgi:hypothetical protein